MNYGRQENGMQVLIEDIQVYLTAPDGQNLVVVKVFTNQPGLYGLGCATNSYRATAVREVVLHDLKPVLIGRDVSRIEDLWKLMNVNGYWRYGPINNNAISGVDMALWDIKAKLANMPLYDLLGGKCREKVTAYLHCNAPTTEEIIEKTKKAVAGGCRNLRVAYTAYDGPGGDGGYICLQTTGKTYDPKRHMKNIVRLLEDLRDRYGDTVELITDTHQRLDPADAIALARALEPLHLLYMEDPLPLEMIDWLPRLREGCKTPIAFGENLSNPADAHRLIANRWIDYIRCHLSDIGGLTPARKITHLAEIYGVRTSWHAPLDMSPIAMAVQTHLDYAAPNFGVQEFYAAGEQSYAIFPGAPFYRDGAVWLNEKPGHGVDFNEKEAGKFPPHDRPTVWTEMRLPDGTLHTP